MASAYCINTRSWIAARLVCFVHVVTGHREATRSLSLKKMGPSEVISTSQVRMLYCQARGKMQQQSCPLTLYGYGFTQMYGYWYR